MDNSAPQESIVDLFDSACFSFGDEDAILLYDAPLSSSLAQEEPIRICYLELQEYSKDVARQLFHRFRPSYVLVDCCGHAAAEAVALLACIRIGVPFVPVSASTTSPERFNVVVQELRGGPSCNTSQETTTSTTTTVDSTVTTIAAIVCCKDDQDPILGIFADANVHQILFVDFMGNLQERLHVRDDIPSYTEGSENCWNDNLYILTTSGTTTSSDSTAYVQQINTERNYGNDLPVPKMVIGSHKSTLRRLEWFQDTFAPSPRIGRRTKLTFVDGITELLGAILFPQHQQWSESPQQLLVALRQPQRLQTEGLVALLDLRVTQLTMLPSQLAQILLLPKDRLIDLNRVIVSGEPCTVALLDAFQHIMPENATLLNFYGQTETTGDVTCANLTDMSRTMAVVNNVVAVGTPILPCIRITTRATATNTTDCLEELFIEGNLSSGYLNAKLQQQQSMTIFATGDVGFCHNDVWYVQGRTNDAYKVNGIWTFPGEIESEFIKFWSSKGTLMKMMVVAIILNDYIYIVLEEEERNDSVEEGSSAALIQRFSRQRMKEAGLSWNVIPHYILVYPNGPFPRNSANGGAAKINRQAIKDFVQTHIQRSDTNSIIVRTTTTSREDIFDSILINVLRLQVNEMENNIKNEDNKCIMSKSFVELGGDSRSAMTFLYHLVQQSFDTSHIDAVDILRCTNSINELKAAVLLGKPVPNQTKRQKSQESTQVINRCHPSFISQDIIYFSNNHIAIQFWACVDAPPLIHHYHNSKNNKMVSIFAACQGGVVQRMQICNDNENENHDSSLISCEIVACHHFHGWMIEAGLVVIDDESLIVSCYNRDCNKSMVTNSSLDLKHIRWQQQFLDGQIKSTPVVIGSHLCVSLGDKIIALDMTTGNSAFQCHLPLQTTTQPTIINLVSQGSNAATTTKTATLIYASCEYDSGLMVIDTNIESSKCSNIDAVLQCSDELGPVHKNPTQLLDGSFVITDSYGCIHHITMLNKVEDDKKKNELSIISSQKISSTNKPLTSACVMEDIQLIVVGSYDSIVYGLNLLDFSILWTISVKAAVYASPLRMNDSSFATHRNAAVVILTTTAGDVIQLGVSQKNGHANWSKRLAGGEIWSDARQIDGNRFLLGARDSRLHIFESIDKS